MGELEERPGLKRRNTVFIQNQIEEHRRKHVGFRTAAQQDGGEEVKLEKGDDMIHILSLLFWITFSLACGFYAYSDGPWYDGMIYAAIMGCGAVLLITLNWIDDDKYGWKKFQSNTESIFGYGGVMVYGIGFFVSSILAWVIIALDEDDIWTGMVPYTLIFVFYYLAITCMFLALAAYWEMLSFYCAHYSAFHGLMYLSVLGGLILKNARLLRPPKQEVMSWHRFHDIDELMSGTLLILNYSWLFFVVLGCVGLALFSEFSIWVAGLGTAVALILFTVLAFGIMLCPIAPGSMIDCCAGFLFLVVFVKNDGLNFWVAWFITILILIVYHYTGACIQWWIGKIPSVQIWLNTFMPVDMLSTSDAVLGDASWFKVGLVGYVFLDTINGLNQGRINMNFYTQLLSEWACVPAAVSLSALGASIAVEAVEELSHMEWASIAAPLLLILSGLVSVGGSLFGLKELGTSLDKKICWESREKWSTMHFFHKDGLHATSEGWEQDVFELANTTNEREPSESLFAKVYPLQMHYVADYRSAKLQRDKLMIMDTFLTNLAALREEHYSSVEAKKDELVKAGMLIKASEEVDHANESYWANAKDVPWKRYVQYFVVITLTMAFWGSIVGFYMEVEMDVAVAGGWNSVTHIHWVYWVALIYFLVVYNLYNFDYWIETVASTWSSLIWSCTGCPTTEGLETLYTTPKFTIPVDIERGVLEKIKADHTPEMSMQKIVEEAPENSENQYLYKES